MRKNVGTLDRLVRVIIALALFSLLFLETGTVRWLGLVGIVPLLTAFAGFCPLYSLLGIRSCASQKAS